MAVDNKDVMLVLCRKVISGLLIEAIQKRIEMAAFGVYEFNKAKNMALVRQPKIALVEIPERHGTPSQDALDVCEEIKEVSPGCKVMLICPENDEGSVKACLDAVKKGKVNDFLFYDSSVDYLIAKLESLLPV